MSLILFILGFILVVYLIFKFIKKVVFAVITLVLLVVLIFASVIGLVYLDLNNLASQKDFDIQIVYSNEDEYILGVSIPVENQTPIVEQTSGLPESELVSLDVEQIEDEDNKFVIVIDDSVYQEILNEDEYVVPGLEVPEDYTYETKLDKEELVTIMETNDMEELVDILIDKNNVTGLELIFFEPIVTEMVSTRLENNSLELDETAFLLGLYENIQDEKNVLTLIEAYKEGDIEVYPDRFTFKLLRMLPAGTVSSYIPSFEMDMGYKEYD